MTASPSPGAPQGPPARSCLECRRLKRKCNRELPCSDCIKHSRACEYDRVIRPKVTRQQLDEAEEKITRLQALLNQYVPEFQGDQRAQQSSPRKRKSPSVTPTPDASASALLSLSTSYELPQPTGLPTNNFMPAATPPLFNNLTPRHSSPLSSPRRPLKQMRQWSSSAVVPRPLVPLAETSMPEKQPKNAGGYEWNEREGAAGDGTGSLSIEPDGNGYLGFASGASLLRILQICAGGLSLSRISTPHPSPRMGPVPLFAWDGSEPSESDMNMYLDVYFEQYHPQYPLVHEPTFRAQWNEVVERPPARDWNFLSNVMLAIGAFCARSDTPQIADHFLNKATSKLGVEHLEAGSLVLVQAFTLLSNLTQKRNRLNAGSVYLGIAVRMAIGLGLHRELPLWRITPFERETRRRVWWVLYMFDSGACVTFGRPVLLPENEADVNLVLNIPDRLLTARSRIAPEPVEQPTVYSSLLYQSSLHICANRCYKRVISTPSPSVLELLELGQDLEGWKSSLPPWLIRQEASIAYPWLEFTVQKLIWRYSNLRIILFRRPFLERALRLAPLMPQVLSDVDKTPIGTAELAGVAECLASAQESIHSIHHFFSTHSAAKLEWWYGLHFLFHATFVPLIALHTDPSSASVESWRSDVALAKSTLGLLPGDALAGRCLSIINLLSPPNLPDVDPANNLGQSSLGPLWTDPNFLANLDPTSEPQWFGDELRHTLLPFADLATLAALWPSS